MAPTVARAKTAFQFFQADKLADIKKELGGSMGAAMTELSARWKALSDADKAPYNEQEAQDRERFRKESAIADAEAAAEQEARRNNLIAKDGEETSERGARQRVIADREEKEERRRKRKAQLEAEMDPEVLAERQRVKAAKKAAAAERQRKREEEEALLKARHKKLGKAEAQRASQRLDYLLKQSSIFSKLKMGGSMPLVPVVGRVRRTKRRSRRRAMATSVIIGTTPPLPAKRVGRRVGGPPSSSVGRTATATTRIPRSTSS